MPSIGNVGASALVKSAAGIASQIADYNDKMAALKWNSSAQTVADYTEYSSYLQGRIGNLQSSGSLANASKAISMTGSLQSANRSYVSNEIQRVSIGVLEGSATPVDKQSTIVGLYQQAVANGDTNLAQNLIQQYDSLNQQIQYNAQQAQTAGEALYKANATAQKQGYDSAIQALQSHLDTVSRDYSQGGQGVITANLKKLAGNLGIQIPTGSAANNGSLIEGVINTIAKYHSLAAESVANTDASAYMNEMQTASDIINNVRSFNVGGTQFTLQDAQFYAQHPEAYFQTTTGLDAEGRPKYGLKQAAVTGYNYDAQGNIVPTFSANDQTSLAGDKNGQDQAVKDLQGAGFTVKMNADGTMTATQSTDGRNAFFQNATKDYGVSKGTQFIVTKTNQGYQFAPITDKNGNQQLLMLAKDATGKFGLYNNNFNKTTGTSGFDLIGQFSGYNPINVGLRTAAERAQLPVTGNPLNTTQSVAPAPVAAPVNNIQGGNLTVGKVQGGSVTNATKLQGGTIAPAQSSNTAGKTLQGAVTGNMLQGSGSGGITIGTKPSLNDAIKTAFTNFSSQPSGYTENTILKNIANTYFNGDIKAASTPVYQYRKATFGS